MRIAIKTNIYYKYGNVTDVNVTKNQSSNSSYRTTSLFQDVYNGSVYKIS